jgi:hypothetical protein
LQNFIDITNPDELMLSAHIYDHKARLDSFEQVAALRSHSRLLGTRAKTVA